MYTKLKVNYKNFVDYFPDYNDSVIDYVPPKKFFWDVFSTFDSELAERYIAYSMEQRNKSVEPSDDVVEIKKDVLDNLVKYRFFSKKKGRALFMLKASKDLCSVKRKRKKKFSILDDSVDKSDKSQKLHENKSITEYFDNPRFSKDGDEEEKQSDSIQFGVNEEDMQIDGKVCKKNPFL